MSDKLFIGVATPQANPTVEIEFQRFIRRPAHAVFTRLTSSADSPAQRLREYMQQLPGALKSFDTLPLRLFAFACTGSSYLLGAEQEEQIAASAEQQARVPVITATQAIRRELQGRGAQRVAMLAPYPQALCDAAVEYWASLGVNIIAVERIDVGDDTRAIYDLTDAQVAEALDSFDPADADLILLSGTGMPTIDALRRSGTPVISSNLCLAVEALRRAQQWPPAEAADVNRLLSEKNA